MLKIGLTGGVGSGKTTVSNLFAKLNSPENTLAIIDTDIIAREIVEAGKPAYQAIVDVFGRAILNDDLTINRVALRKIIFSEPDLKSKLESITHPAIQTEVTNALSGLNVKYCIIVIPLLFETKSDYKLDRILVIDSDKNLQIERTVQRDNVLPDDVNRMIQSQTSRDYRLQHADDIITNNGRPEALLPQVEALHHLYLKLANIPK